MTYYNSPIDVAFSLLIAVLIVYNVYSFYYWIIYPYYLGPYKNIPRVQNGLVHYMKLYYNRLIGSPDYYLQLTKNHGPVVHLVKNWVLVNDPILKKLWSSYQFPKSYSYRAFNIYGPNIFSSFDRDFHNFRKKMILPSFTKKHLKYNGFVYQVGSQSLVDMFNEKISQGQSNVFDLYHYFECSALDVITTLSIGYSLNTVNDIKFDTEFFRVYYYSMWVLFLKGLIPSISAMPVPTVERYKYLIEESVKRRQLDDIHCDDVLQSLMEGEDPKTGENLTLTEIIEEFFIILYAGLDTTSNTMTWTLFEILSNAEVYDMIKSEVLENFPDLSKPLNIGDCEAKLKYLEAAIWESMRKHSVVEMFARRVPEGGVTIADHYLPEKTVIMLNLYAYHNNPKIWTNPREFNINRWLGEEREKSMDNFIGFGTGPRSCIGKDLAWAELFLVLANLIRNFDMELIDKELAAEIYFMYKPKLGRMNVALTPRV